MAVIEHLLDMKRRGDFGALHTAIPYTRFLGLSLAEEDGRYITTLNYHDELIGNTLLPALHGGTISALLEMASLFQLACEMEPEVMPKVVTITVDYMRSGKPVDTFASAQATRVGRRVANLRAEAWQEDRARLIATANVNFLLT